MKDKKLLIPFVIIVIGLVVAGAIFFSKKNKTISTEDQLKQEIEKTKEIPKINITPISSDDHILGNPDAEVSIIEYSDFECFYCIKFEPTMEKIMAEYGETGKVAWVYRHFPIDKIHPKARLAAEASECVAEQKGNAGFWEYSKKLFDGSPDSLSKENLILNATSIGVEEKKFSECLESKKFAQKVENNYQDGLKAVESDPNFGTPYSIVQKKDGTQMVIRGAQPYELVKKVIDGLLFK